MTESTPSTALFPKKSIVHIKVVCLNCQNPGNVIKADQSKFSYQEVHWRADFERHWWLCPETAAAGGLPPQVPVWPFAVSGLAWLDTAGAAPGHAGHLKKT